MWKPEFWIWILLLARKREVALGGTSQLSFINILLAIIVSLKSCLAEVIKTHNQHYQPQCNAN